MADIINATETGVASDALAEGHFYVGCVIRAVGADLYFQIDGTASAASGELIPSNTSATINNLNGKRLSLFSATSTPYTLRPIL
jgi:hypothetical protein